MASDKITSVSNYHLHDHDPFLIEFPEGFFLDGIRWYGLAYVAGFLIAWWLLSFYYRMGRSPMDADRRSTLITAIFFGTLVGGRLGYMLFYDTVDFFKNPFIFFRVWEGGMASHGGFIGIGLALLWFARRSQMSFYSLSDIVVTVGPPGLFFGRLANYMNGELWGKVTDVPWAVIFQRAQLFPYFEQDKFTVHHVGFSRLVNPRHPSQLYEAALEGLILFALVQWRFWKFPKLPAGQLAAEFLIAYAILRMLGEAFREPDADLIIGLSRGVFYSLFMITAGVALWFRTRRLG